MKIQTHGKQGFLLMAAACWLGGVVSIQAQGEAAPKPKPAKPVPAAVATGAKAKPATPPAAASDSLADPRLVKALKDMDYRFVEIDNGILKLSFELAEGRSQLVFMASRAQRNGAMETRKIWSTAMKSKDLLSKEVANQLLQDTDKQAFGAWELVKWPDGYRVLFVAAVPADLSGEALKAAIRMVFSKADAMEEMLTKEDAF